MTDMAYMDARPTTEAEDLKILALIAVLVIPSAWVWLEVIQYVF